MKKGILLSFCIVLASTGVTSAFADVWYVQAPNNNTAVWTEQSPPGTNPATYKGIWTNSSGQQHGATESISIVGNTVSVYEIWDYGGICEYSGNQTNNLVSGTYICGGQSPLPWSAKIEPNIKRK